MADSYNVVALNQPLRILGFTLAQASTIAIATVVSIVILFTFDRHEGFNGIPQNFVAGLISISILLAPLGIISARRPLKWWMRFFKYAFNKKLPVSFPEVSLQQAATIGASGSAPKKIQITVSNSNQAYLEINKAEFSNLSWEERSEILNKLIDFVGVQRHSMQIFVPAKRVTPTRKERQFFLVANKDEAQIEDLAGELHCAGITNTRTDERAMRELLFAYLSPSHFDAKIEAPEVSEESNNLLALCLGGFEQKSNHLLIDGKYVSSYFFQVLPEQAHFGFLSRLLSIDDELSLSIHFKSGSDKLKSRMKRRVLDQEAANGTAISYDLAGFLNSKSQAIELGVYLTFYADTLEDLILKRILLISYAQQFGGTIAKTIVQEFDALLTMLPINQDLIESKHTVLPVVAQTFFPFV